MLFLYHNNLNAVYRWEGNPLPVFKYQSASLRSAKNSFASFSARVSDHMGVCASSRLPFLSIGTTPRLCPEMARARMVFLSIPEVLRSFSVLLITDSHQSAGRCSCHPMHGYIVSYGSK